MLPFSGLALESLGLPKDWIFESVVNLSSKMEAYLSGARAVDMTQKIG
jgi:hypothetical protein